MSDDPTTEELRVAQLKREQSEAELAQDAETAQDESAHERRADKAAYLREKVEQQQVADQERD